MTSVSWRFPHKIKNAGTWLVVYIWQTSKPFGYFFVVFTVSAGCDGVSSVPLFYSTNVGEREMNHPKSRIRILRIKDLNLRSKSLRQEDMGGDISMIQVPFHKSVTLGCLTPSLRPFYCLIPPSRSDLSVVNKLWSTVFIPPLEIRFLGKKGKLMES